MANNASRFYFCIPRGDGTAFMGMFFNKDFNPSVSITDQLDKCSFYDYMPLNEMLELGSSLITCATASARQFQEAVRVARVRSAAVEEVSKPANAQELAKIAAFLDGVNLDPSAAPPHVMKAIQEHADAEEAQANAEESQ
jgi:hypothetical protein